MLCSEIDVKNINYVSTSKFIKINYNDNNLIILTGKVYIPFGFEKNFNNFYLKILKQKDSEILFEKIKELEDNNITYLNSENNIKDIKYNSQIKIKNNYGVFLSLKIPYKNGQYLVDIYDKDQDRKTVFDIKKNQYAEITIEMDSIWYFKNSYSSVLKIKSLVLV